MSVNKVIYNGRALIDLTGDTVTPESLLSGKRAHDKSGEIISGKIQPDQVIPIGATEQSITLSINDINNNAVKDSSNNIIYGKNVYRLA